MNRRSFLKIAGTAGLLAVTPITLASALATKVPIIYGDGIHDDTEGLQAAVSGKDFVCESGIVHVSGNTVNILGGTFLISDTITITDTRTFVSGSNFVMSGTGREDGRFMLDMQSSQEMVFRNCHFDYAGLKFSAAPSEKRLADYRAKLDGYVNLKFP